LAIDPRSGIPSVAYIDGGNTLVGVRTMPTRLPTQGATINLSATAEDQLRQAAAFGPAGIGKMAIAGANRVAALGAADASGKWELLETPRRSDSNPVLGGAYSETWQAPGTPGLVVDAIFAGPQVFSIWPSNAQ